VRFGKGTCRDPTHPHKKDSKSHVCPLSRRGVSWERVIHSGEGLAAERVARLKPKTQIVGAGEERGKISVSVAVKANFHVGDLFGARERKEASG